MDGSSHTAPAGQADCVHRAQEVAAALRAGGKRIESNREVPPDLMDKLHDARLFRIALPRSIGGDEADLSSLAAVTEIIAAADASTAWCIGQAAGCAMSAASLAPDVAKRLFGARDAVLAWGAGAAGKAVAVPGGYRIDGTWSFASGSRPATMLGAHCKIFEADGTTPRLRPDGRQLERTALLSRDKAAIQDDWKVMGLRGTGSDSYTVRDLVVPDAETLDRESSAEVRETGPLFKFPSIQCYAAVFAGVMLGISRGAIDDLVTLAQTKTPRGAPSTLRDNPIVQSEIAILEGRWRAARHYHHNTLKALWQRALAGQPITLQDRIDGRLSSTHALNQCVEIVVAIYRLAGQNAIFDANPFEQRLRDAMTASQQVQSRPSHFVTVGRHLLGLPPDTMMFL